MPLTHWLAAAAVLVAPLAGAADGKASDARKRYQEERAACVNTKSGEDRTACLREAGAALQEARRGGLNEAPAAYEQNKLARCNYLPAGDRQDCERRMRGEGTVSGSVEGGGIYRELVTRVPAEQ